MQPTVMLAQIIKSGKVTISTKDTEELEIKVANKRLEVNALDKEFLKGILAAIRQGNKKDSNKPANRLFLDGVKSTQKSLDMLREVAEDLRDAGVTVALSYRGDLVATIGAQARPKFSSFVTGTNAIEINSLIKLLEIGL